MQLKFYEALAVSFLTSGSEIWTLTENAKKGIEAGQMWSFIYVVGKSQSTSKAKTLNKTRTL
jgi:hypothetical protein